jgi:predicted small metal-binding protein
MHNITCQDVSGLACDFVAQGETTEEAMMDLRNHGMETHPTELQQMMNDGMTEEMLVEKMKSADKEV